jgi:cell division protein FtsB
VAPSDRSSRRTTLTGRAAVLALVVCALVVMLADPIRQYIAQRSQIAGQRSANAALQREVDSLIAQQRLWSDPNYVRQQARERLYYVMPGETPFVVVGGQGPARLAPGGPRAAAGVTSGSAWYGRLWSSVQQAGSSAQPAGSSAPQVGKGR